MQGRDRHEDREIAIFSHFAKVCGLPVQPNSIEKREPPEPDIRCTLAGAGPVAFEMVELIHGDFAALASDAMTYQQLFEEAYQHLPVAQRRELENRCGNALVHVVFRPNAVSPQRRGAIPYVLAWLQELEAGFAGDVYPEARSALGKAIGKITLCRGNFIGPCFNVESGGIFADPSLDSVLAYHERQPVLPGTTWVSRLHALLARQVKGSGFRRVWVFDLQSNEITFVCERQ